MTEEEWFACKKPERMIEFLHGDALNTLPERRCRLLCVAGCRRLPRLFLSGACDTALNAAERYADGAATSDELYDAYRELGSRSFVTRGVGPAEAMYAFEAVQRACEREHAASAWRAVIALQHAARVGQRDAAAVMLAALVRDIFGNPFRSVTFDPGWRTDTAVSLARQMYEGREFSAMPILADALQDAGCDCDAILDHCRDAHARHVRGCWVVDIVLRKS
jgi:hypothetical protein